MIEIRIIISEKKLNNPFPGYPRSCGLDLQTEKKREKRILHQKKHSLSRNPNRKRRRERREKRDAERRKTPPQGRRRSRTRRRAEEEEDKDKEDKEVEKKERMNQPSRAEKFVVPPGSRKLSYTPDTKLANAGEFVLLREDHTLGNMLRMELHNDPNVVFAGYQHPHPTDHRIIIKVHTNGETNPVRAMKEANQRLTEQVESLKTQWESELESVRDSGAI